MSINDSHSLIIDYPIDYNIFPLAKNEKMYKIELNKNEYLTIPRLWFHWVFTEPNTVSINYEIPYIKFTSEENRFFRSFKYNNPFKSYNPNIDIKYNDFIQSSLDNNFRAIISETNDCSPVIKNSSIKYFYNNSLSNIITKNSDYIYIGKNTINQNNILFPLSHIDTIIKKEEYDNIYYNSSVWFTLDKMINSGLHHDNTYNIIHVLDGKKTIYLFHPESERNLYIRDMLHISSKS